MHFFILAAGFGSRLMPHTADKPKCLMPVAGKTVLEWQIAAARQAGIDQITVIGGHGAAHLYDYDVNVIVNADYASTNMVASLFCGRKRMGEQFVVSYGDIVYQTEVLAALLASPREIAVVVDNGWLPYWSARFDDPLDDAETLVLDDDRIVEIGQKPKDLSSIASQYIGLMKFSGAGVQAVHDVYATAMAEADAPQGALGSGRKPKDLYMTDLLQGLIAAGHPVHAVPIERQWLEIDSCRDLDYARRVARDVDGKLCVTDEQRVG